MKTFTRDDIGALVDAVQNDIDVILQHSSRSVVRLPDETIFDEDDFWNGLRAYNHFYFRTMPYEFRELFNPERGNIAWPKRSETGENLSDYLYSIYDLKEKHESLIYEEFRSSENFKFFFFSVASKKELNEFHENQETLIAKFVDRLKKSKTSEPLSLSPKYYGDEVTDAGSAKRIVRYVQSHLKHFGNLNNMNGIYNYVPELGFRLGHDLAGMEALVHDIIQQGPNIFYDKVKLTRRYGITYQELFKFLFAHREKFLEHDAMKPILSITDKVSEALKLSWVRTANDISSLVAKYLYDEFDIDITPGQANFIISAAYDNDKPSAYREFIGQKRRKNDKHPHPAIKFTSSVLNENDMEVDVSQIFAEETGTRPRKVQQETGGGAGLGPQKPTDLWKNEKK